MAQIIIADANSSLVGTAGDDQYVTQPATSFLVLASAFQAGEGFDTLQLNAAPAPIPTPAGALTSYTFTDLRSLEHITYAGLAGQWILLTTRFGELSEGTTIVGSQGRDGIVLQITAAGDYTMPALKLQNWGPAPGLETTGGDYVGLIAMDSGNHILRARDDFATRQVLQGGTGNDVLYGGNGADTLQFSGGVDQLYGDGGDDLFIAPPVPLTIAAAGAVVDGGDGHDRLLIQSQLTLGEATISGVEEVIFRNLSAPPGTPLSFPPRLDLTAGYLAPEVLASGNGRFALQLTDQGVADLSGVTFADGASIEITIDGSDTGDVITGSSVADVLNGRGGDDVVRAGEGDDTVYGGVGDDRLFGEVGDDYIVEDDGDDVISGGDGDDVLIGGIGRDEIDGDDGNDFIQGGSDNDLLRGGRDNDNLSGEAGDDRLFGGAGIDILDGGLGNDTLDGGLDTDIFVFVQSPVNGGHDRINGFTTEDFLVTLEPLFDGNGDGIIGFGSNRILDIGKGFDARITGGNGRSVTALEHDGSFSIGPVELHVYSLVGSTLDFHAFLDLP